MLLRKSGSGLVVKGYEPGLRGYLAQPPSYGPPMESCDKHVLLYCRLFHKLLVVARLGVCYPGALQPDKLPDLVSLLQKGQLLLWPATVSLHCSAWSGMPPRAGLLESQHCCSLQVGA